MKYEMERAVAVFQSVNIPLTPLEVSLAPTPVAHGGVRRNPGQNPLGQNLLGQKTLGQNPLHT